MLALAIGAVALFAGWVVLPIVSQRLLGGDAEPPEPESPAVQARLWLRCAWTWALAVALFALAGPIADAYGGAALQWPLRWVALAVAAQGWYGVLAGRGHITRATPFGGAGSWTCSSCVQAVDIVALVAGGAGLAGAVLGRVGGYLLAAAGLFLFAPGQADGDRIRRPRSGARAPTERGGRRRRDWWAAIGLVRSSSLPSSPRRHWADSARCCRLRR